MIFKLENGDVVNGSYNGNFRFLDRSKNCGTVRNL